MNFNFHEQYQSYPTAELLKIIQNQADYQPEAIEAANKILAQRTISNSDFEEAQAHTDNLAAEKQKRKNIAKAYKEKAADLLEPITQPTTELNPEKWLRLFLLAVTALYLYSAYKNVVYISWCIKSSNYSLDLTIFLAIINLLYTPLLLWFLYKRKKIGWILLLINSLLIVMFSLYGLPTFLFQIFHHGNVIEYLSTTILNAAFVNFLWRQKIADLFSISKLTKKKTLKYTLVFGVILIGLTYVATSYMATGRPFSF